jgi:hypothetical protein
MKIKQPKPRASVCTMAAVNMDVRIPELRPEVTKLENVLKKIAKKHNCQIRCHIEVWELGK